MRRFTLVFALLAGSAFGQVANNASPSEFLCSADAIAIAPGHNFLRDGTHSVALSWNADANTLWYRVYRSGTSGGPYALIADCISGLAYTDFTVADGQAYFYVITAVNGVGESSNSSEVSVQIPVYDAIVTLQAHLAAISESLSTTDTLTRKQGLARVLSENLTGSDSLARQAAHFTRPAEALSTSAGLGAAFTGPNSIDLTEDLTTADNPGRGTTLVRGLADSGSVADAIGAGQGYVFIPTAHAPQLYFLGSYGLAAAEGCGFTLTLTGANFTSLSVANWNGGMRPTVYVSSTTLAMSITAADLASTGTFAITVNNYGGQVSPAKTFTVVPAAPAISGARLAGSMLVIDGADFVPSYGAALATTVFWNGTALPTRWISPTRLQAQIPPKNFAAGGNVLTVADVGCTSY